MTASARLKGSILLPIVPSWWPALQTSDLFSQPLQLWAASPFDRSIYECVYRCVYVWTCLHVCDRCTYVRVCLFYIQISDCSRPPGWALSDALGNHRIKINVELRVSSVYSETAHLWECSWAGSYVLAHRPWAIINRMMNAQAVGTGRVAFIHWGSPMAARRPCEWRGQGSRACEGSWACWRDTCMLCGLPWVAVWSFGSTALG